MTRQLSLDFEFRPSLSGEDFLVAPANREAVAWLDRWPDWHPPLLLVHGPAGCGKTHLANVFAARSGARFVSAEALRESEPAALLAPTGACVIESPPVGPGEEAAEEALFHLYNLALGGAGQVLLTARRPAARWPVVLPDLRSRLGALAVAPIGAPDDGLMQAVLLKLFSDRQLKVDLEVISFMLARMERSFETARSLVAAVDAAALAKRRNITKPLVREVMERAAQG